MQHYTYMHVQYNQFGLKTKYFDSNFLLRLQKQEAFHDNCNNSFWSQNAQYDF